VNQECPRVPDEQATAEWASVELSGATYQEVSLLRRDEKAASIVLHECAEILLILGGGADSSPCVLRPGSEYPHLNAEHVVVQPDVVDRCPGFGLVPIGGRYPSLVILGRADSQELRLGADVSRGHCTVKSLGAGSVEIVDCSLNGTRVLVRTDDLSRAELGGTA
jgi:hypothetical protein